MLVVTAVLLIGYAALVLTATAFVRRTSVVAPGLPVFVSVLVAARNEEQTLGDCLEALLGQSYPRDLYEILVADDHSTDRTADVAARYGVRCLHVSDEVLPGKPGALHT
ncbi:MAG: glycosyltransferase, partial [Rhodothermales bacterium]